jgi:hypothetical protein
MDYITQEEASKQLGVKRASLYYYMKTLKIQGKKFPLDKHVYLEMPDFEKIKALKEGAARRSEESKPEEAVA